MSAKSWEIPRYARDTSLARNFISRQRLAKLVILMFFGATVHSPKAIAQTAAAVPAAIPAGATNSSGSPATAVLAIPPLSMPWRLVGIDSEEQALAEPALIQTAAALAKQWLSTPQPLTTYAARKKPVPLNAKRVTDLITTGEASRAVPAGTIITVEPVWCSLMDQQLLFVTIADAQRDTLLASSHVLIAKKTWADAARKKTLPALLQAKTEALLESSWQKLTARDTTPPNNAMHIGMSLGYNVSRRDEGDSQCLNMLVTEKLAPIYTTVRDLGADRLATVRFVLGLDPVLTRASRVVLARWLTTARKPAERHLPATFTLDATLVESVFGKRIPTPHMSTWTFAPGSAGSVAFTLDPKLEAFFRNEAESLKLADLPQVAKVDRAWVYLDRGRAWGLKMRDRLVADAGGTPVEGHVVRFFGPEEKLTSPRGFPIREGAIVYVRKNQKFSKTGLTFTFDPTTYPTAWPPK